MAFCSRPASDPTPPKPCYAVARRYFAILVATLRSATVASCKDWAKSEAAPLASGLLSRANQLNLEIRDRRVQSLLLHDGSASTECSRMYFSWSMEILLGP